MKSTTILGLFFLMLSVVSCQKATENQKKATTQTETEYPYLNLSDEFKTHWFDGKAEVASYDLTQMRYGEARKGSAVLIFVKEPFLQKEQVKADRASDENIDVMKLNYTKKFNTGIYPYSIMQSVFSPLTTQPHAIKVTASTQEWCGQTYMQLNNRDQFEIQVNSYFEGEADQNLKLDKQFLENELFVKLRINPKEIPQGQMKVIPDFSYLRLQHKSIKAYQAEVKQTSKNDTLITSLKYEDIDRILNIYQDGTFPYQILKWEEKETEADENFTVATLQKNMRIDYWNKNSNIFLRLRDSLNLK